MAAIVRVKRRITEDPFSTLVLDCKRRKTGNEETTPNLNVESNDQTSTILKFAGTIGTQEDNIATQISKLRKHDAKKVVQKQRTTEISEKCRQQMRHNSHDKRLKVVNCYRTPNEEEGAQEITIVEIERDSESCSGDNSCTNSKPEELDNSFVYDLYVPENVEQNNSINYDDTYLSVRTFDDLVYEDKFSNSEDEESEDSNREDYWKNEYPDTEEESSDSEIQRAVKNLDLEDELSSDEDHCWSDGIHSYDCDADEGSFDIDCIATQEEDGSSKSRDYDDEDDSDLD